MSISKGLAAAALMGLLAVIVLWAYGCNDKPTDPPPPPEPPDYILYMNQFGYDSTYFAYHVSSGQLDTFHIPGPRLYDLDVAADGRRLYIRYLDFVRVTSTEDYTTIAELPYLSAWSVAVSPDNRHIALHSGSLHILTTDDYAEVFHDTFAFADGVFSANGDLYYSTGGSPEYRYVYRLDMANGYRPGIRKVPGREPISRMLPSANDSLWFLYRQVQDCYSLFQVYDHVADTILFTEYLAPGCGDMAITVDSRYVCFTGPGDLHTWPPPVYSFAVYDVEQRAIDTMTYWSICGLSDSTGIIGDKVCITPDSKYLIVAEAFPGERLAVYDLQAGCIATILCVQGTDIFYPTIQNAP